MAACSECGEELQGQRRVVCGERCKARRKVRLARERYALTAVKMSDRECPFCGTTFSPKTANQLLCGSADCNRKRINANRRAFCARERVSGSGKYDNPLNPMRKCHGVPELGISCDEMTYNYRCDKCRARMRAAYDVVEGRTGLDQMYGGAA